MSIKNTRTTASLFKIITNWNSNKRQVLKTVRLEASSVHYLWALKVRKILISRRLVIAYAIENEIVLDKLLAGAQVCQVAEILWVKTIFKHVNIQNKRDAKRTVVSPLAIGKRKRYATTDVRPTSTKNVRATVSAWLSTSPRWMLFTPAWSVLPSGQTLNRSADGQMSGWRLIVVVKLS